jgi:hypothetical protein
VSLNVWKPTEIWKGDDVFIIGGGPSLIGFNWSVLTEEHVIGCNDAYIHGPEICDICIFGDHGFWCKWRDELARFRGIVVTNRTSSAKHGPKWLKFMTRKPGALYTDALGWGGHGGNTGISAINLAFILGAQTVYLLGFDMKRRKERAKWHTRILSQASIRDDAYVRFQGAFEKVATDLPKVFPGRQIINVTDDSALQQFPKVRVSKFWNERLEERRLMKDKAYG